MEHGATLFETTNNTRTQETPLAKPINPTNQETTAMPPRKRKKRNLFSMPTLTMIPEEITIKEEQIKV